MAISSDSHVAAVGDVPRVLVLRGGMDLDLRDASTWLGGLAEGAKPACVDTPGNVRWPGPTDRDAFGVDGWRVDVVSRWSRTLEER